MAGRAGLCVLGPQHRSAVCCFIPSLIVDSAGVNYTYLYQQSGEPTQGWKHMQGPVNTGLTGFGGPIRWTVLDYTTNGDGTEMGHIVCSRCFGVVCVLRCLLVCLRRLWLVAGSDACW